jgi:hypothetical protein
MEFLAWPGWAGVGAIATILSLATLVFAVARFIIQRRQMPLFRLSWEFIGTATADGKQYHLVEFRNVGRGTGDFVTFTMCGARAEATEGFLAPRMIASGQTFRLLVTSPDLSTAWVRWSYRTLDHATRVTFVWRSLIRTGPMAQQYKRELENWESRSYYDMMRDAARPRPVGPGGAPVGTVVYSNGAVEKIAKLLDLDRPGEIHSSVFAGSEEPAALNYVPHPSTIPTR